MAEDAPTVDAPVEEPKQEEQRVPYERFEQVNKKAKEAADKAAEAERRAQELQRQLEERESSSLPELERIKKAAEQAEKRAAEAERRAEAAEAERERVRKERWVTTAAKDFVDPDDATRYVDFDSIDDVQDAERAVKSVAKQKPHLLKRDEAPLPGRVLQNGRPPEGKQSGGIDLDAEAQMVSNQLKQFLKENR